ncbi:hypothetical protein FGG08_006490 [Glutinoglossum americanum]|uniref:Ankyrin repeat domain-containing protein 50 n=1 Tax=Glutinoglossum americanum TaxID=1670608 RepID=A0A9P8HW80_9PEZI|nr:hypothetical protein FGG08_006490 [Glutinoglossum americanum]
MPTNMGFLKALDYGFLRKKLSIVVNELLANSRDGYCLAYFYCSRNAAEPERSNPEDIIRSIVRQISSPPPGESVLGPVTEKYEERKRKSFANGPLSLEESVEVIIELTSYYLRTTIVIDALDECDRNTRHRMLKALDSILQKSSGLVKIFVSSRDDQDIVLRLESSPNMYIKASDNAPDIRQYVQNEVRQAIYDKRLLGGDISEQLRGDIIRTLTEQAQGMFLWVSLQLQNLCSNRIKLERDLREELGSLPQGLMSIYSEIFKEISNLGPSSRTIAERSLKWILCSQRRLSVSEFLAAISTDSEGTLTEVRKENVLRICCNLIVLDLELDIFRFAHLSVREFLEGQEEYTSTAANALAAERCLTVCLGNISAPAAVIAVNTTFRNYAVMHWPIHCQMSEDRRSKDKLGDLFHDLLKRQLGETSPFAEWARSAEAALPSHAGSDDDIQRRIRSTISSPPDPVFAACVWGFSEIIQDLLRLKSKGRFQSIRSLLGSKLKVLKETNLKGETYLHCASTYGHCKIAQLLVEKGADVNARDSDGWTALHREAIAGHEAGLRLLVEKGADVDARDSDGWTALHGAASNGHEVAVRLLVEKGADVNARDGDGDTVLHRAAGNGHEAVVRLLVEKGADVNAKDRYGWTALHRAAGDRHEAVVQLLVEKGADVNAKDRHGNTALYRAAGNGHETVVRLLVEKGADVNAKNRYGDTALHNAAHHGYETVRHGREAVVRLLVEKRADVNAKNDNGWTALHGAAINGHEVAVRLLVEKGADVNARDGDGDTVLHRAAGNGHEAVVRLLVEKGADVNARDGDGDTVLHRAAGKGHEAVVRLLVEKGADVSAKDRCGDTALHRAAGNGYKAVTQLLAPHGTKRLVNRPLANRPRTPCPPP